MLTPKGSFHNNDQDILCNNILRDAHVGTSICFRGQANKVVAGSKANQLDPQIRQIGLRKGVYYCVMFALLSCCLVPYAGLLRLGPSVSITNMPLKAAFRI